MELEVQAEILEKTAEEEIANCLKVDEVDEVNQDIVKNQENELEKLVEKQEIKKNLHTFIIY